MVWHLQTVSPEDLDVITEHFRSVSQASVAPSQTIRASEAGQPQETQNLYLVAGTYSVGRKDCDICLKFDSGVSRRHAELVVSTKRPGEPQTITVCDVGSTYGTTVLVGGGGMPVKCGSKAEPAEPRVLADGDVVRVGQQRSALRVRWVPLVFCVTRVNKEVCTVRAKRGGACAGRVGP